jgi:predicted SpoU family rRNA methylase
MLQVTDIQYIRQEVNIKGCSYADVARRTNKDYRTIKKYADMEEFQPKGNIKKSQPASVMDPVKDIVDQWGSSFNVTQLQYVKPNFVS